MHKPWVDGPVGKLLAMQAQEPELRSLAPTQKPYVVAHTCHLSANGLPRQNV